MPLLVGVVAIVVAVAIAVSGVILWKPVKKPIVDDYPDQPIAPVIIRRLERR